MTAKFYSKLYEILATYHYNTERVELMEEVLKYFLTTRDCNLSIPSKAREIYNNKVVSSMKLRAIKKVDSFGDFLKSEWFKQKCVLLHNIPKEFVPEYITMKFRPFSKIFEEKFGLNISSLWLFSFKLSEYLQFKKYMINFKDETYKFKSKEEYADLGFVAVPSTSYVEKWKNIVTLSIPELKRIFSGILSHFELEKVLEMFSMHLKDIHKDDVHINFSLKPLLRIDENTLVVLNAEYLTRALPIKYEKMLKDIKEYREAKGKSFEILAQDTLKMLPFKSLTFNVKYGDSSEVDAILEFENSLWFVEITSHSLSDRALEGDLIAIKKDLKKSIIKCIKQGKRCFEFCSTQPLSYYFAKGKINGVMIIVDGIYPQLNLNTYIDFFTEKIPIYVINWFDLRTLIDQPELSSFEDFLLWRVQQPMPIISFDEKDYWAFYFDHYTRDEEMKKTFKAMQEKNLRIFYISYRFNNKEYLEKLIS